jgi:hypothetical protein
MSNPNQPAGFRVEVVRPCFLVGKGYQPSPEPVVLPLADAQDAIASGRCREVDKLPRLQDRP